MDYKTHIMQAINYIEENLKYDISIPACAQIAGYSNYHFIRIFKEATGLTPADYIRKRRLTEIIKHMENNNSISEIAFDYGFNSKENFTRAFLSEHHILPTDYKSTWNSLKLYEPITFTMKPYELHQIITYIKPFHLTVLISDETYPPNFWNKYNRCKWSKKLSGGKICEDYGVSYWNEKHSRLDYYIGIHKDNAICEIDITQELYIPGGLYAIFSTPATSHYDFVIAIHRTWFYINNHWLPNSMYKRRNGYEFETYIEDSRTFSEKIYIPLKEDFNEKTT